MPKYNTSYYKKYIANHQIEPLLEQLLQHLHQYLSFYPNSHLKNTYDALIMQSGKWKSIRQEESLNIAEPQAAKREKARISQAVLGIINGLPAYYFDFLNGDKKQQKAASPDLRQQVEKVHKSSAFEYDVFFSFSSQDLHEAKRICEELRGYGLHVFLSDEALKVNTGTSFFEKIEQALKNSQHFILLSSVSSMTAEWVKIEYETFFNEYYIKNKKERRFFILKSKNFSASLVPGLLKRLQFANNPKEILATFIKDKRFQDRQAEKKRQAAARALEQQAIEEKKRREQQSLQEKALEEQRQREATRLQQEQEAARQAKQKALQAQALKEQKERERQVKERQMATERAKQEAAEKRKKQEERKAAWVAFWDKNGKKLGFGILALMLLIIAGQVIPSMVSGGDSKENPTAIDRTDSLESTDLSPIIIALESNMKTIPSGTFTMGCTSEQSGCQDDEKPTHEVSISSFKMNKYEVTQEEWRAVMGSDPPELRFKGCNKCPVENVSWNDIQDFLKKLNQLTGKNYRLPSEAEWEYAARGNENYKYAGSNDIGSVAWYDGNSGSKTHAVGGKRANGFGLYDMSGNVYEWCQDNWHNDYNGAPNDGRAWTSSSSSSSSSPRVVRGGSWRGDAQNCRVASRYGSRPGTRSRLIGFRLAHR